MHDGKKVDCAIKIGQFETEPTDEIPFSNGNDGKSAYQIWLEAGNTGSETEFLNSLKGENGRNGSDGKDGQNGSDGKDGFSPAVSVSENTSSSYKLAITDKNNTIITPNLKGSNGTQGSSGADGKDGFSPVISVSENTSSSYKLALTDKNGTIITPNLKASADSSSFVTIDTAQNISGANNFENSVTMTKGMKIYSASNDNSGRTLFSSIYMPQDDHAAITFAFNSDKKSDGDDSEDVRLDFINSDSGNVIQPRVSNNFSIGTANRKFYNGYFTNLYGSLKGNADTASKAFQDADGNAFADKYVTIDITDEWSGKYKKKV